MKSAKEKLLSGAQVGHSKLKDRFALNPNSRELKNAYVRTDELSPNPITGLYLVVSKKLWPRFPLTMKFVWIASVLVSAGVQWLTALFLYIYFRPANNNNDDTSSDDSSSSSSKSSIDGYTLLTALLSCGLLFVYVLGEIRRSLLTLRHYWVVLEFTFFQYWIFSVLVGDILLHLAVAALSILAIGDQDNISDQLGISLSFFFILEFDEWMYDVFIKDFDVLEDDDFTVEIVDSVRADDLEEFWDKKAKWGMIWFFILIFLLICVVIYFAVSE